MTMKNYRLLSSQPKLTRSAVDFWREGPYSFVKQKSNMAVRVGNGRYYKLFSGSSQLKRLFIDDISEPGMLEEEYIQGKVAFFPKLCWVLFCKACTEVTSCTFLTTLRISYEATVALLNCKPL